MRRCIGSTRFDIEAHEAPENEFPLQPSQKDGYGRMCKTHWNVYTAGLARDAKARKAAPEAAVAEAAATDLPVEVKARRARKANTDAAVAEAIPD